jgi:lipoprotein-anchoring transpeptidase ErfK/SrfK
MRARRLVFVLLMLSCVGCGADPAHSHSVLTPTVLPTATVLAAPTPTPTFTASASPTATRTRTPLPTSTPGPEAIYRRLVVIDQEVQTMYVYEDGVRIRSIPCSTGKPGEETHTPAWEGEVGKYVGTFFSFGVYADDAWYLFDHYGGMLIHSAPYLNEDGVKVYQDLDALGVRPTSHGCIRLPPEDAAWFSEWNPQGAHVIITPPRNDE